VVTAGNIKEKLDVTEILYKGFSYPSHYNFQCDSVSNT
jgi:hypothetical protein